MQSDSLAATRRPVENKTLAIMLVLSAGENVVLLVGVLPALIRWWLDWYLCE